MLHRDPGAAVPTLPNGRELAKTRNPRQHRQTKLIRHYAERRAAYIFPEIVRGASETLWRARAIYWCDVQR